jgi:metal-responsive CopG/Arc/MetJ family transcriptional regulator
MDEPNSERIITPMPKSLVQAIDDFRFGHRVASRAEAIRRLIELGLRAAHDHSGPRELKRQST